MTFWSDSSNSGQGRTVIGSSYPSGVVCFKITEGMTFIDPTGQEQLRVAKTLGAAAKLDVVLGYHVLTDTPVAQQFATIKSAVGQPFPQFALMVDVETWAGRMGGNHTAEIEQLLKLARAWLGGHDRAGVYGNRYDLAEMYPGRPKGTWYGEANYGPRVLQFDNDRLWQQYYGGPTGNAVPAGFPTSMKPFGSYIDLNYSPLSSKQLAQRMGLTATVPPTVAAPVQEDDDMKYLVHALDKGPGDTERPWFVVLGDRWIKCSETEARWMCTFYGIEWDAKPLSMAQINALAKIAARPNGVR